MSKHIPEPWKVEKELTSTIGEWLITKDAGDRGRGIAIAETVPATGKELANARLIAAAPDLLEALQYMLAVCPPIDEIGEEAKNQARAAIAKALEANTTTAKTQL